MARIVGVTNERTRNTVTVGARKANVCCGADILLTGLYQDVNGEAVCPVCGSRVEVAIGQGRAVSATPSTAILHYVVEDRGRFTIRCRDTIIFDKESCLREWLGSHGGKGKVSTLSGFMKEAVAQRRQTQARQ